MGISKVKAKIIAEKEVEKELIVDTGSVYTWINKKQLAEIGVKQHAERTFKITGELVNRGIGRAQIEINGRREFTVIVLAEEKDQEVIGLHALEGLGLEVDVTTGKLKEAESILALLESRP
jgi:predicted aspartyl protease